MQTVQHYPAGTFCWVDLATVDADAAKRFYGALFGWSFVDVAAGEDMIYTMCKHDGHDVCALYGMNAGMREQGVPPHWASFVSVGDVDAAVESARELGAGIPMPPFDVMAAGRRAMIQDPTGAMLHLWQPGVHIGARAVNQPWTLVWNELATRDPGAAQTFYSSLFGWTAKTSPGPMGPYTSFEMNGRLIGGMLAIGADWGDVPPHWGVYFGVEDCDASAAEVTGQGGKVVMGPMDIAGVGRFAVAVDPQGAAFNMIKPDAADPPPG